jgi:biopolymer transport protein ExbD
MPPSPRLKNEADLMRRKKQLDTPDMPIAPMIDCVFLMLVYFMTTSSLEKSEADLPVPVGQAGMSADPLPAVDEQQLAVDAEGAVLWNGSRFALLGEAPAPAGLRQRLARFKGTCDQAGSEPSIRILPDAQAPHQALVTLLDALGDAGIETIQLP